MQRETITVGELRLRPFEEADIPWVYGVSLDPRVQKYVQIPYPYQLSDAEYFVREMAVAGWDAGIRAEFVIETAAPVTAFADGPVRLGRMGLGLDRSGAGQVRAGLGWAGRVLVEATLRQRLVHRGGRVDAWVGSMLPAELPTRPGSSVQV